MIEPQLNFLSTDRTSIEFPINNVRAIPTMLLFKGGDVVDQIVGMTSKADLTAKLEAQA